MGAPLLSTKSQKLHVKNVPRTPLSQDVQLFHAQNQVIQKAPLPSTKSQKLHVKNVPRTPLSRDVQLFHAQNQVIQKALLPSTKSQKLRVKNVLKTDHDLAVMSSRARHLSTQSRMQNKFQQKVLLRIRSSGKGMFRIDYE